MSRAKLINGQGALEGHGILEPPARREGSVRDMRAAGRPAWASAPDRRPETAAPLSGLRPPGLEPVTGTEGRRLWNAFVDRRHHPGYRRPFGARVRHSVSG